LRLFVEKDIRRSPVIDSGGELVGVVTTSDILRAEDEEHGTVAVESDYPGWLVEFSAPNGQSAALAPPVEDRRANACGDRSSTVARAQPQASPGGS